MAASAEAVPTSVTLKLCAAIRRTARTRSRSCAPTVRTAGRSWRKQLQGRRLGSSQGSDAAAAERNVCHGGDGGEVGHDADAGDDAHRADDGSEEGHEGGQQDAVAGRNARRGHGGDEEERRRRWEEGGDEADEGRVGAAGTGVRGAPIAAPGEAAGSLARRPPRGPPREHARKRGVP